ncbi:MAG: glycosyltransferase family 4 protein [Parvibaculum sp.]
MPAGVRRIATWHMGRPIKARWLDGVVLISEWQKSLLPPKSKLAHCVVNNWVSHFPPPDSARLTALRQELDIGERDFVAGFVGRPSPYKGVRESVEAFRLWAKEDAHFLVVGGTVEGVQFHEKTGNPNIHAMGYRTDVRDIYSLLDCMVAPSYAEPFGLVVIEAMRAGCRVIVRDTCGLHDIAAANADVIAVPTSDPAEILEALKRAYALRDTPPSYDMSPYEKADRVADIEAFYRTL